MKIYSWNVNGLRAVIRKGALKEFLIQGTINKYLLV
jgi:exonuclease III